MTPSTTRRNKKTTFMPPTTTTTNCHNFTLLLPIFLLVSLISSSYSFDILPKSWMFRGHPIAYDEAKLIQSPPSPSSSSSILADSTNNDKKAVQEPILLLNGFGVGSFHQHRLMQSLSSFQDEENRRRNVYGIDYLGQGKSWPIDCKDGFSKNEEGLIYSVDTWANQIINFIEEIILPQNANQKVHLVGNSIGGHLSVIIASRRPDLISTVTLLNATPIWGLNLPFWSGVLPPPSIPKAIGSYLFDRIRDPNTIQKYLEVAYGNKEAFDDVLVKQIRGCTEGKGGHAAFASILWSPPARIVGDDGSETNEAAEYYSLLATLQCDVLLLFGACDPWCTPSFAKRMFHTLSTRSTITTAATTSSSMDNGKKIQRYIELENIGHCPNHEAPNAVGRTVHRWISSTKRDRKSLALVDDAEQDIFMENSWGGQSIMREVSEEESDKGLSLLDKVMTSMVS